MITVSIDRELLANIQAELDDVHDALVGELGNCTWTEDIRRISSTFRILLNQSYEETPIE